MQKVFQNGSDYDNREIMIKIEGEFIEFFFYEQYRRKEKWVEEETERRLESGEDDLTDDEKENYNFYWIGIDDWNKDKNGDVTGGHNWHRHMNDKSWFTYQMESFIDANVK